MVGFSFISARFLGVNNADEVLAPPCEDDSIDISVDATKSNETGFSVILPVVDPFQNLVGKNFSSGQERDTVFGEIGFSFRFVPLEFQVYGPYRLSLNYTQKCTQCFSQEVRIRGECLNPVD